MVTTDVAAAVDASAERSSVSVDTSAITVVVRGPGGCAVYVTGPRPYIICTDDGAHAPRFESCAGWSANDVAAALVYHAVTVAP